MLKLNGAMLAIVTPFDDDNTVDHRALARLTERQIAGGSSGIIVCGTTGEAATMSQAEQLAALKTVVETVRGAVPVIAGTGTANTAATVAMTRLAMESGADAALVVCPPYNKPNQAGLYAHFVAAADVGLPVVAYNVPSRCAVGMTAETVGRVAAIEGVVGIKEASANMAFDTACMEIANFAHLSGDDFTTYPFVAMGGHGCVSVVANLDPQLVTDAVNAALSGDRARGAILHRKICRLAKICFADPNPVPVKAMLAEICLCRPHVRLPLVPLEPDALARVKATLAEEGYRV